MAIRNLPVWRNLTLVIVGAVALATGIAGACGSLGGDEEQQAAALQQGHPASMELVDRIPDEYGATPGGVLVHRDCVHQIPDGAVVNSDFSVTLNGKKIAQYADCTHKPYRLARKGEGAQALALGTGKAPAPGTGNGWVENSWGWASQTMFTHMDSGFWTVPAAPSVNDGQLLFYFPSFESSDYIIQPVLQWGVSFAGGGQFWAVADWIVLGNTTKFVSALHTVSSGSSIWGSLDLGFNSATSQSWTVTVNGPGFSASITGTTDGNPFNSAQAGVLEAYGVSRCSDFPSGSAGSTYFSRPVLYQGNSYHDRNLFNPSWFLVDYNSNAWAGPLCNFSASTVDSVGNTTIDY